MWKWEIRYGTGYYLRIGPTQDQNSLAMVKATIVSEDNHLDFYAEKLN